MGETIRDALRWLGSPFTAGAVAVLALNDHVLKQAWPGLVTGKLSDAAGLVVAPPLVALLLALTRVRWSPLLVTGVGFAVVKTLPLAADAASAALGWVAGPSYVRADPTDLLTLPALVLAHHARRTSTEATSTAGRVRLAIGALLLPLAVVATAATSPCYAPRGAFEVEAFTGEWSDAPGSDTTRVVVHSESLTGGGDVVTVDVQGRVGLLPPGDAARLIDGGSRLRRDCTTTRPRSCWQVTSRPDRWKVTPHDRRPGTRDRVRVGRRRAADAAGRAGRELRQPPGGRAERPRGAGRPGGHGRGGGRRERRPAGPVAGRHVAAGAAEPAAPVDVPHGDTGHGADRAADTAAVADPDPVPGRRPPDRRPGRRPRRARRRA